MALDLNLGQSNSASNVANTGNFTQANQAEVNVDLGSFGSWGGYGSPTNVDVGQSNEASNIANTGNFQQVNQGAIDIDMGGFGLGFPVFGGSPTSVGLGQSNEASNVANTGDFTQANQADIDLDLDGGFGGMLGCWGPIGGGAGPVDVNVEQSNHADNIANTGDFTQSNQAAIDIDLGSPFDFFPA